MKNALVAVVVCFVSVFNVAAQWTPATATGTTPIHYDGNVTIGTTATPATLRVVGPSLSNGIYAGYNDAVSLGNADNGQMIHFGGTTSIDLILASFAPAGNVGIGTLTPGAKLQIAGDLRIGSNSTNTDLKIFTDSPTALNGVSYNQINSVTPVTIPSSGTVTHTALYLKSATATGQGTNQIDLIVDGNIAAKFQDVAEWVPATTTMAPGTVVILNSNRPNEVMPSNRAYDTKVAGVVSAQPGLILGEAGGSKARIATTGRVKVRVDASKHPVKIGDLLVTSNTPGMAMVSEPLDLGGVKFHRPGTLIGKALQPLSSSEGEILVLLSLQ